MYFQSIPGITTPPLRSRSNGTLLVCCHAKPTSSEIAKTRKQRQAFELSADPLFGVMCWGNLKFRVHILRVVCRSSKWRNLAARITEFDEDEGLPLSFTNEAIQAAKDAFAARGCAKHDVVVVNFAHCAAALIVQFASCTGKATSY